MINKMTLETIFPCNAHDSYQTSEVHISWYSAAWKRASKKAKRTMQFQGVTVSNVLDLHGRTWLVCFSFDQFFYHFFHPVNNFGHSCPNPVPVLITLLPTHDLISKLLPMLLGKKYYSGKNYVGCSLHKPAFHHKLGFCSKIELVSFYNRKSSIYF